jgi:hypothetical protein
MVMLVRDDRNVRLSKNGVVNNSVVGLDGNEVGVVPSNGGMSPVIVIV